MSEAKFQIITNGTQVLQDDMNLLGETSGLADDRVIAELFRGVTNTSPAAKFIIPNDTGNGTVFSTGSANGSVFIRPFRAIVGSRTAEATDSKKFKTDCRSAVHYSSPTQLIKTLAFTANASGNPRWDLVYAIVTPDSNTAGVVRKIKDPATGVVSSSSVSVSKVTTVSTSIQVGTPAASPTWPASPADGGGSFYIPLAYVRIPNGFTAGSTILPADVAVIAPILSISPAMGGSRIQPASSTYTSGGGALTTARIQAWGASGTKPAYFLPSTMAGEDVRWIVIDMTDGSAANWSHVDGAVVDNSISWGNRIVSWTAMVQASTYAWAGGSTPDSTVADTTSVFSGMGNTFSGGMAVTLTHTNVPALVATTSINLHEVAGALKVFNTSAGGVTTPLSGQIIIRLCASGVIV